MFMNETKQLRMVSGLSQAELAVRAGTSQPTIAAYENRSKVPNLRTLTRMAEAVGLHLSIEFFAPLSHEEHRSLEIHRAIAGHLHQDQDPVIDRARRNLVKMRSLHPHARPLLDEWAVLLALPPETLTRILVDPSPHARDLRQVTPFAGVLSAAERTQVIRRVRAQRNQRERLRASKRARSSENEIGAV
jgi:transcriptional regulator with XRE-family HTH domain